MVLIAAALLAAAPQNVILITWDGARWQDVFDRTEQAALPRFFSRHLGRATVFGDPGSTVKFEVANDALVSLPAYQELLTGGPVDCDGNACGRVRNETLIDTLEAHGLGGRYAVFGSWKSIALAASVLNRRDVDAGRQDGEPGTPWGTARLDRVTWAKAMAAIARQPSFLWVALNDADEWGHLGRRERYVRTLRRYDRWLDELLERLEAMPGYGENTTVIITTDHGRGDGDDWTEHGRSLPESRRIFAFAIGPGTGAKLAGERTFTHRDIRPTVEALLGLSPAARPLPGVMPFKGSPADPTLGRKCTGCSSSSDHDRPGSSRSATGPARDVKSVARRGPESGRSR